MTLIPGSTWGTDHPRRCGEHVSQGVERPRVWGSSPQMRGARCFVLYFEWFGGIIPADAGSTRRSGRHEDRPADHPRRCGERPGTPAQPWTVSGSSPQMRGALQRGRARAPMVRIIPADAGSTGLLVSYIEEQPDHPRRCGEHPVSTWAIRMVAGSSPQMRGAPGHIWPGSSAQRIIPADAGSTCPSVEFFAEVEDHPRRCGEHGREPGWRRAS